MQRDALRACIMDVHYQTVTVSDSERSLSVLLVELRLIVVVVVYMECDSNVGCVTEHYACADRLPAPVKGEDSTVPGLRRVAKPQSSVDGRSRQNRGVIKKM